jgi:hypothetical protein
MLKKFVVNLGGLAILAILGLTVLDPHMTIAQNIGGGGTINGNSITTGTGTLTLGSGVLSVRNGVTVSFSAVQPYGTIPVTHEEASYVVPTTSEFFLNTLSNAVQTVTLPAAASYPGHMMTFNTQYSDVVSDGSNVVPCAGGSAGISIVSTAGKWATMVSDGSNWRIVKCN